MNCERFQMIVNDLARKQIMATPELESARAHVDECDRCQQALSDQHELSERLRAMAHQMKSLTAPEHLEAHLLAAFHDQIRGRAIQPERRYWMAAVAAVLLVAFGLLAWRWHLASGSPPSVLVSSRNVSGAPPQSLKQAQLPALAVTGTQPTTKRSIKRAFTTSRQPVSSQPARDNSSKPSAEPAVVRQANAETREVTTEFVPIGYGSAFDLQDGGQLVRVELPRSALARFGLPMNMNRADERIKADVLVGADGLARAIRFVSSNQ